MVSEIQEKTSELRAFDALSSRGFLLAKQPYQESDLIVDLLLERGLRLSALARGGQKSIKRFGGRLEPLQLLQFQLRAPRGNVTYENLFFLEAVEVVEIFEVFRSSWIALNDGLFYTEFIRDLLLKGEIEDWVYPCAQRLFAIGNQLARDTEASSWRKVYAWSFFARQMGFGILGERGLFRDMLADDFPEWKKILESEFFCEESLRSLGSLSENVLDKKILRDLYSDWMQRSHLKCRSLESLLS